jgi:hypothetical protein
LFNVAFVLAAIVGAAVIPASGKSYALLIACAAGYVLTAVGYGAASTTRSPPRQ